jgi:hypothetical protein
MLKCPDRRVALTNGKNHRQAPADIKTGRRSWSPITFVRVDRSVKTLFKRRRRSAPQNELHDRSSSRTLSPFVALAPTAAANTIVPSVHAVMMGL